MRKGAKSKKGRPPGRGPAAPAYSPEAQEVRALLRRVPDGFQAGLNALAARPAPERERVMTELARGMGKEVLPLLRSAALGGNEELALSALRVLPVLGTRAAGDVLAEAHAAWPDSERARAAAEGGQALQALGIHVAIEGLEERRAEPRLTLRETSVCAPDGVGSRSVAARFQDEYGVWHAVIVLWNDRAGVKDGFTRPFSRQEWAEYVERMGTRASAPAVSPPDFARWQVEQARRLNEQTGFPLEDHLEAWDAHVGPPPAGYEPPDPSAPLRDASEAELAELLDGGTRLFDLPAVRSWFVEAEDCAAWARRWSDLQARIRLRGESDELKREIVQLVKNATDDLIAGAELRLYRERLLDLSRACGWRHDETSARRAAAVVAALDAGRAPGEIPFFMALLERSLMATTEMLARGEDLRRTRYRPMRRVQ
jgi:hypothetical protein